MRRGAAGLLLLLALGRTSAARAQITQEPAAPHPGPTKFARGLYGEAEAGALMFVGEGGPELGPGAAIGARLGYDLLGWAAVQLHAFGSTHSTSFPNMPQTDQLLQLYQATAEVKLTLRFDRFSASAVGGGGFARLSTNLLGTAGLTNPDVRTTPVLLGGLGADYHTMSRHFSFGVTVSFARYQQLYTTGAIGSTAYVRYTF